MSASSRWTPPYVTLFQFCIPSPSTRWMVNSQIQSILDWWSSLSGKTASGSFLRKTLLTFFYFIWFLFSRKTRTKFAAALYSILNHGIATFRKFDEETSCQVGYEYRCKFIINHLISCNHIWHCRVYIFLKPTFVSKFPKIILNVIPNLWCTKKNQIQ